MITVSPHFTRKRTRERYLNLDRGQNNVASMSNVIVKVESEGTFYLLLYQAKPIIQQELESHCQ